MSEQNWIAGEAALACTFIVLHPIRHAFRDEELERIFEDIYASVKGAIEAAFATKEQEGG
jgi:hypothetical protein